MADGKQYPVSVPYGMTALEAVRFADIPIYSPCGGNGTCGKCRAKITGNISVMDEREKNFLSEEEREKGIRLACMCRLYGDFEIDIQYGNLRVQTDFKGISYTFSPLVKDKGENLLGLAADIGTTTVALYLSDLQNGKILATRGFRNPQSAYGADVISRIDKIMKDKNALVMQQKLIADAIREAASDMCVSVGRSEMDIVSAVFCGNTVMQHMAAGLDPSTIANAPFIAPTLFGEEYDAYQLGFLKNKDAFVYFAPCFASYVGGDIACGMIASGLDACRERVLYIDVGTNGEIGLATEKGLYFCSAAAGPAFEGAHIACGMAGITGAVSEVFIENGKIGYRTVDDADAVGICGSGIIDAIAVMLDTGLVDETGCIAEKEDAGEYASYIDEDDDGNPVFMLDKEKNIYICGRDIREIQLAKAAICAGVDTLLHEADVSYESLSDVVIAGGFGSHLRAESICRIGMIPPIDTKKISFVGNAAGAGALSILLGAEPRESAKTICARSEYTELSKNAYFMEKYIEEMMFTEGES
ncbi:MAG: DUF4445 domain-containing protein [Clostridia bacterium]|nr:DUF4445 domain-containing protein [Clostridia bacterium]